ncbi:HupE/UreJ family protein [Vibrio sp. Of7-15]|uniref:HupE/UreJ family protein n=1 Tax=Vibrio sp. Of7-15 TaxID=2724879 RepID=UPI001EF1F0D8|nr:HupE/UreJ family protein [Vibrio sp. Of7-15]MCG7497403.1 HupE/UreJ family protein [Vibrio sp. Of7-15]
MNIMRFVPALALFASTSAFSHPGHGEYNSVIQGVLHPITGLDHLVMLLGFGILLSLLLTRSLQVTGNVKQTNTQKTWLMAFLALASLGAGFIIGNLAGALGAVEILISASIALVGMSIWCAFSAPEKLLSLLSVVAGGLLFFHGIAHGAEAQGSVYGFGSGMLLSAAALMACGYRLGQFVTSKWVGVGIGASGFVLMLSA